MLKPWPRDPVAQSINFNLKQNYSLPKTLLVVYSLDKRDLFLPGSGVALQVRVDFPEVEKVSHGEEASLGPCGVQDGSGVTLGQDETVVVRALRILHVVPANIYRYTVSSFVFFFANM